jgi:hypothetical protein
MEKKATMKEYINDLIVDVASSAFRGIGYAADAITPRQTGSPPTTTKASGTPVVIEISLIRIVVNFGR